MRITLDHAVFDVRTEDEASALLDLFSTAARDTHHHALLTDPVYVLGGIHLDIETWLAQRPPREVNAFRAALLRGIIAAGGPRSAPAEGPRVAPSLDTTQPRTWHIPGPLAIRVERRQTSDWRGRLLTVSDAADLLREPVHLVLENARTDLAFVGHLAGTTNGATLRALLERPGKIETHGGGGGEAKRWVEGLVHTAPTAAQWRRMLRAWVLFDQDAGDTDVRHPSSSAMALMRACEQVVAVFGAGLSWTCLRRREIESYIPDAGLRAASQAPVVQQVIAWRSDPAMAPHAWAFDLKNGLRGDLRAALPQPDREALKARTIPLAAHMLKPPFDALTPAEVLSLDHKLGERLGTALREPTAPTWVGDLPAEYDRGPPHPALPAPTYRDQPARVDLVQSLFDRM